LALVVDDHRDAALTLSMALARLRRELD